MYRPGSLRDAAVEQQKHALPFSTLIRFWLVVAAERVHPNPFRTRKLSSPAPMVLRWRRRGRVGRCQPFVPKARFPSWESGFRCFLGNEESCAGAGVGWADQGGCHAPADRLYSARPGRCVPCSGHHLVSCTAREPPPTAPVLAGRRIRGCIHLSDFRVPKFAQVWAMQGYWKLCVLTSDALSASDVGEGQGEPYPHHE